MTRLFPHGKSPVKKRSFVIHGRKTSVSLEQEFKDALEVIAKARGMTENALVTQIDDERTHDNLSSAIRLFVLAHYRAASVAVVQVGEPR